MILLPSVRRQIEAAIKSAVWMRGDGCWHGTSSTWLITLFDVGPTGAATLMPSFSGLPGDHVGANTMELPTDLVTDGIAWAQEHVTTVNDLKKKRE